MQQRREQCGRWRWSREPAHWIMTTSSTGMRPSDAWALPVVEHVAQLDLGDDALVVGVELGVVLPRRRLAADGGEDGAGVDLDALGRLGEVDGLDGALLGALAAEGAGVEVDGAHRRGRRRTR